MKQLNLTYVFNRNKRLDKYGKGTIHLRIFIGKLDYFYTGIKVLPNQFRNGRIRNHPFSVTLNRKLKYFEDKAYQYYLDNNGIIDTTALKSHLQDRELSKDFIVFVEVEMKQEIEKFKRGQKVGDELNTLSKSTLDQHEIMFKFLKQYKKSIPFGLLNYRFISDFNTFLLKQKNKVVKSGDKNLSQSYANSMLRILKKYTNLAIKKGLIDKNPFTGFSIKKVKKDITPLNHSDVLKILDIDLSDRRGNIELVRDAFVFSCFTGLRLSDVLRVKEAVFTVDIKNGLLMEYIPFKTRKHRPVIRVVTPLSLLFNGIPEKILKKYNRDLSGFSPNSTSRLLNPIGYERKLNFHLARHSFNAMLEMMQVSLSNRALLMGHKNANTTEQHYKHSDIEMAIVGIKKVFN